MSEHEVGIGLQGNQSPAAYARIAAMAEDYGFDVISVFSDFMYQPAIFPLLILAQNSKRVRLGPACLNPFALHPVEIAGQIAALDIVSGGRAFLGLARGTWLERAEITQAHAVTAIRDAAAIAQRLLARSPNGHNGRVFSLQPGTVLAFEPLRPAVPLLIGTWSPKTAALAGEIADEVKVGGTANPPMVRRMHDLTAVGARRAGRADASVGIVTGAVTVVAEDRQRARAIARSAVRMYVDVVARLDPTADSGAGDQLSDELLDKFAMAGTAEDVASQTAELFDAGARRVEFGSPYGIDAEQGIRLLGERVLPLLRRQGWLASP